MSSFDARLRLPGQSKLPLVVTADIADELLTLTAKGLKVAEWSLNDIEVISLADGFHITITDDHEEIILNVIDSDQFAVEVGVDGRRTKALVTTTTGQPAQITGLPNNPQSGLQTANGTTPTHPDAPTRSQPDYDDLKNRAADIAKALGSDTVSPAEVFAQWLGMLKEINHRHGRGLIPKGVYYELNTQLLDLMPQPNRSSADRSGTA